ncbi:MAG: hypothetical protein RIG63_23760 [Coleofasciculus chthonoplastes F3-SA18-01]
MEFIFPVWELGVNSIILLGNAPGAQRGYCGVLGGVRSRWFFEH